MILRLLTPFILAGFLLLNPQWGFSQTNPTADINIHPKVNLYNPNRGYQRPVMTFWEDLGFRVGSDFMSRYVWNGIAESLGPVWQPSGAIEYKGFGISVQANFVLNDEPNQGQFNEVDFTGYWGGKFANLEIDVSFTYSIYPNDNPASLNFSPNCAAGNFHLAYPVGPVNLFGDVSVWVYNPLGGFFADFGLGYQRDLPLNFSITTAVLLGFSNGLYNITQVGVDVGATANLFNYNLAFPWSPIKDLIITPEFNVSALLDRQLRAGVRFPTNVWGNLQVSYNF